MLADQTLFDVGRGKRSTSTSDQRRQLQNFIYYVHIALNRENFSVQLDD